MLCLFSSKLNTTKETPSFQSAVATQSFIFFFKKKLNYFLSASRKSMLQTFDFFFRANAQKNKSKALLKKKF